MAKTNPTQKTATVLGQHSRLQIPFSWTLGGTPIDLQADGYTARVWVTAVDGLAVAGPFTATVSGTLATYQLSAGDLDEPSGDDGTGLNVKVVCVAENGTNTLVSAGREITVGAWGGAADYTPAP